MKKIILFLILLSLSGCDENVKSFQRKASIFNGETLIKTEKFEGTISKKDNFFIYKYTSQQDSSKIISIKFDKTSNDLYFGLEEFGRTNERVFVEKALSKNDFVLYDLKDPYPDGTGPILFNQEYGLLAIYNTLGPAIIFLSNKKDKNLEYRILNELQK